MNTIGARGVYYERYEDSSNYHVYGQSMNKQRIVPIAVFCSVFGGGYHSKADCGEWNRLGLRRLDMYLCIDHIKLDFANV